MTCDDYQEPPGCAESGCHYDASVCDMHYGKLEAERDGLVEALEEARQLLDEQRISHYWIACQRHRELEHSKYEWGAESALNCKETWCATMTSLDAKVRGVLPEYIALAAARQGAKEAGNGSA